MTSNKMIADIENSYLAKAEDLDDETRLAVTVWVFRHLVDHATEGGTFRYLIYDRLGFGPEAYIPLCGDGMTISNEFDIAFKSEVIKIAQDNKLEPLKRTLMMCDEPDCFAPSCCGWPDPDTKTYRVTCRVHVKNKAP